MQIEKLKGHIPESVYAQIPDVISKFGIDTPLKMCHFLAQCHQESGGFTVTVENLNYSANRLLQVFPKYFPNIDAANVYARKPEKIANKVYGNRLGNGNEASGDGWKFRGRGYIQLTGHDNYKAFDQFVSDDILANPDLVATKYPLLSAAWFFSKNCLKRCTRNDVDSVTSVTKCVNGGKMGLQERINYFNQYSKILS